MATTEIKQFCSNTAGAGGNRLTPGAYAALTAILANGYQAGIAESNQINTTLAQSSFMAAGLANWMVAQGVSVPDDGNLGNLVTEITSAMNAFLATNGGFTTGDTKNTYKTTADTGWVMMNDGTIGDASSGGTTRANADTVNLFTLLWNNCTDSACPVSGGRGGSAAADFGAHKTIALPLYKGRATAGAGTGAGLTARALGAVFGEEAHALTSGENGTHNHAITDPGHTHNLYSNNSAQNGSTVGGLQETGIIVVCGASSGSAGTPTSTIGTSGTPVASTDTTGITVNNSGSGTAHNTMQPTTFLNMMIKL